MPVQSQIISCPAGQWTAIAENMELRTALMVQCPEAAITVNKSLVTLPLNTTTALLAANPLRRSFFVCVNNGDFLLSTDATDFTVDAPVIHGIELADGETDTFLVSEEPGSFGAAVQLAWWIYTNTNASKFPMWEDVYTCRAVILGMSTNTPIYAGPYGNAPMGIWTSPDLAGGPAIFKLSDDLDDDLTHQEWWAWPVGTGNINLQVLQSFKDAPAFNPSSYGTFQVGLPQLSPVGKFHLDSLRRKIAGQLYDWKNPDEGGP